MPKRDGKANGGPLTSPLMTPAEAAEYLAISTRQLRDLSRDGSIRYVNIGLRERVTRRYAIEDLEAFINSRRQNVSVPIDPAALAAFQARLDARARKSRKEP